MDFNLDRLLPERWYYRGCKLRSDSDEFLAARKKVIEELQETYAGLPPDQVESIVTVAFGLSAQFGFEIGYRYGDIKGWEAGVNDERTRDLKDSPEDFDQMERENKRDAETMLSVIYH